MTVQAKENEVLATKTKPLSQQWRLGLNVKQAKDDAEAAQMEASQVRLSSVGRGAACTSRSGPRKHCRRRGRRSRAVEPANGRTAGRRLTLTTDQRQFATVTQEEARQRALAARPEIKEARIRLEQANLSVRSKKLEQIPDLSLLVSDIYLLNTSN